MAKSKRKFVTEYKGFDEAVATAAEVQEYVKTHQREITKEEMEAATAVIMEKGFMSVADFRAIFGIAFSTDMTGKMETIIALSSSCIVNPFCLARMLDGDSICSHCFSVGLQLFKPNVRENTIENFKILNTMVIPAKYWPLVCNDMLRFEAFGDVWTWKQVANYFECARRNKGTRCALWTKNPEIVKQAIAHGYKKPKNLVIVYSSPKVNTVAERLALLEKYDFIDKIFTVFEKEFVIANNIDINCGARSCRGCQRCYYKETGWEVREQLK